MNLCAASQRLLSCRCSWAIVCAVVAAAAGCSSEPADEANWSRDSVRTAPDQTSADSDRWRIGPIAAVYYASSPAQGRPPDGELPPHTPVRVIERAGSYALVEWEDGTGWVSTDALEPVSGSPLKVHKIPMH